MTALAIPLALIALACIGIGFLAGLMVGERLGWMAAVQALEDMPAGQTADAVMVAVTSTRTGWRLALDMAKGSYAYSRRHGLSVWHSLRGAISIFVDYWRQS